MPQKDGRFLMSEVTVDGLDRPTSPRRVFKFLILYRWLSLIPPLVTLFLTDEKSLTLITLLVAAGTNILISLFPGQLNRALRTRPWLLAVDLGLTAVLVALTGGWQSPYYLYALNPLLAAAFFFQLRGALLATTLFLPLYLAGVLAATALSNEPVDWLAVVTAVVGLYLISGAFGYASILVNQLRSARDSLVDAHRDLGVIHDLTVSMQSAADVEEVQERVLEAVTVNLCFERAAVGLVDQDRDLITGWLARARDGQMLSNGGMPYLPQIPLSHEGGATAKALLAQQVLQSTSQPGTADSWVQTCFGMTEYRIFPMLLREHAVGVLLVDSTDLLEDSARLRSLESITNQAAVAIGTTMLCIDRAQRLAVQEERLRIAQDIHDTVSQSLFGIVYTLDGSLKLLPEQPDVVIPELERALRVAEETHQEVRQSILNIWPSEITSDRFVDGLRKYTNNVCQAMGLHLVFNMTGDFERLSPQVRRGLYRIAQETLANAAHHAAASEVTISLDVAADQATLSIEDNGRGFEPSTALAREYDREHFGLRGMRERARSLGGRCEIHSRPGSGSSILVDIPLTNSSSHE